MSVCTRALLKGKINPEEIANFLSHHYNLKFNQIRVWDIETDSIIIENKLRPIKQYGENTELWNTNRTCIVFNSPFNKEKRRSIFWYYSDCVFNGEDTHITAQCETTYISLNYDEEAIEIIKAITAHFGGWMDENDCDEISYIKITPESPEAKNKEIKPIFYFTIEELQKHFDGIVKIVSQEEKEKLIEKKNELKKRTKKKGTPLPETPEPTMLWETFSSIKEMEN